MNGNTGRELLPKTMPVAGQTVETTHRVLRGRPSTGQVIVRTPADCRAVPALNVRSCFSFMDSALTIPAIIEAAAAHDVPAEAITDPGLYTAVWELAADFEDYGVMPCTPMAKGSTLLWFIPWNAVVWASAFWCHA
ncbi:hypothetical protein [Prosthecobacter vanneervenii]|uniref:Uncharacterized protein n=1 Tax=Prosthecobacter vanneervenii TaxID=48466 RepID=A0A7W7Y8F2_9BACT|nr:hypothetical protein [Prosthecobacter vanneervenii]MBB5031537.1 hypothetical protein [Prosthecobacter vanneervenii]